MRQSRRVLALLILIVAALPIFPNTSSTVRAEAETTPSWDIEWSITANGTHRSSRWNCSLAIDHKIEVKGTSTVREGADGWMVAKPFNLTVYDDKKEVETCPNSVTKTHEYITDGTRYTGGPDEFWYHPYDFTPLQEDDGSWYFRSYLFGTGFYINGDLARHFTYRSDYSRTGEGQLEPFIYEGLNYSQVMLGPGNIGEVKIPGDATGTAFLLDTTYTVEESIAGGSMPLHVTFHALIRPPKPHLIDLRLEHQDYPSGNWIPVPDSGTYDGNVVKVIAVINNPLPGLNATVKFKGENGELLPGGEVTASLPTGETTVEYLWETEGLAWKGGTPRSTFPLEVWLDNAVEITDIKVKAVTMRPKPVIMVHGVNSNAAAWNNYPGFLRSAHPNWDGFAVDGMNTGTLSFDSPQLITNSIAQNADEVHSFIEKKRAAFDAWHIDIVAHSMGGLISRKYIQDLMPATHEDDNGPVVRRLVMLGTPNQGSACATVGVGALSMTTLGLLNSAFGKPALLALYELAPESVASFNQKVYRQREVQFSIMAGLHYDNFMWCGAPAGPNDGVVSRTSAYAHFTGAVKGTSTYNHIQLETNEHDFLNFVKPRLTESTANVGAQSVAPAADLSVQNVPNVPTIFSEAVRVDNNSSVTVALPVKDGSRLQVTVLAPPSVGVTLRDPNGAAVQTIAAGSPIAQQWFRTVTAASPMSGTWTLQLTNTASKPGLVPVTAMLEGSAATVTLKVGTPTANGEVPLTATVTKAGGAGTGAVVTANLVGTAGGYATLSLLDDGKHGDGAANDGIYGGRTAQLQAQGYAVGVKATWDGTTRIASGIVAVETGDLSVLLPLIRR